MRFQNYPDTCGRGLRIKSRIKMATKCIFKLCEFYNNIDLNTALSLCYISLLDAYHKCEEIKVTILFQ